MNKILLIFLIFGFFSVDIINAKGVCRTKNIKTNSQLNRSQQCLKRAIRNSISIAKDYQNYNNSLLKSLKRYAKKRASCQKKLRDRRYKQYKRCKRQLHKKRRILRVKEEESRFLDNRYVAFKQQIIDLESELELLELDYNNR